MLESSQGRFFFVYPMVNAFFMRGKAMTYEEEFQALIEELMKQREAIYKKYEPQFLSRKDGLLDGDPSLDEIREVTRQFMKELDRVKKKYKKR